MKEEGGKRRAEEGEGEGMGRGEEGRREGEGGGRRGRERGKNGREGEEEEGRKQGMAEKCVAPKRTDRNTDIADIHSPWV